jgi:hypothetical protein
MDDPKKTRQQLSAYHSAPAKAWKKNSWFQVAAVLKFDI